MSRRAAQARIGIGEGMEFIKQKKWDEALAALRAAVEIDPEMSTAWCAIGVAEIMKNGGRPCEAAHDPFKRCVELDPNHVGAHCGLGGVLLRVRNDAVRAEEHIRAVLRLDPKHANAHRILASIFQNRGDLDGTIGAMRDCVAVTGGTQDRADLEKFLAQKRTARRAAKPNPEAKARPPPSRPRRGRA